MRNILIIIIFCFCKTLTSQTYELYKGDTVNYVDVNNKKQGLWIKFNNEGDQILEKGAYLSGQKNGVWISYYPSGNKKHEITYKKGKAIGQARFFYENGLISEEGIWHIDHWQGNYKFYNKSGSLAYDWNYDETGKRTGTQKYYHDNGVLKYSGQWDNGKATGVLKIFDDAGKLITERVYNNGEFQENVAITENITTNEVAPTQVKVAANHDAFTGTGNHTVYNLQGLVEKRGFFVNGKIFTGKHFFYNQDKKLIKVVHYHNGNVSKTETI